MIFIEKNMAADWLDNENFCNQKNWDVAKIKYICVGKHEFLS